MITTINQMAISESVFKGSMFPIRVINSMFNGRKENTQKIDFKELKAKILSYLRINKKAHLSDISEDLDVSLEDLNKATNELEKEKKIF